LKSGPSGLLKSEVGDAVALAYIDARAQLVATLIRITGDWGLAEDSVQEAFAAALTDWGRTGVPRNPAAWLTTVAKNRAIDRIRRASTESRTLKDLAEMNELDEWERAARSGVAIQDDRLRLIFTCCHPALPIESRVALTLRTVTGLSVDEIARAFLVPAETMAKRLVRARAKIRNAGIPYVVPTGDQLSLRTTSVLAVLYLVFNDAYALTGATNSESEARASEAIRLARLLCSLMPGEREAQGLLALIILQNARRAARVSPEGELINLENQNRALWNSAEIGQGIAVLDAMGTGRSVGLYELQAQVVACHVTARDASSTDFATIATLYEQMTRLSSSPVIELNRAVAVAMSKGPAAGLEIVETIAASHALDTYYLLPATAADLLRRLGRLEPAAARYRDAIALAPSVAERRYLEGRLARIQQTDGPG
jgi:RNA polymerase sigma-70 factor, ECF subfamily